MRIGHFNQGMFEPGGMATYVRRISAFQAAQGHDVTCFYIGSPQVVPSAGEPALPCLRYVRDVDDLFTEARRHRLDILHLHNRIDYADAPPLPTIRTIHNHQPYCPSASRFLARSQQVCRCRAGLAVCLRGHLRERCGSVRPHKIWEEFAHARQEQRELRRMPAICISEYMKQEMIRAGYAENLLSVVYHAAPPVTNEASPPPRDMPPRFVYLGRLTELKGANVLLPALQQTTSPIRLDIAGAGPLEAHLRRQAQELGLAAQVCFHGWLDSGQVQLLLRQSRALVFPSAWPEPAGLVTLEAAAQGRAVIGTRVGGLPEYALDGHNALLVAPGNAKALSAAMDRLASDWELARDMGEQGRRLAQETLHAGAPLRPPGPTLRALRPNLEYARRATLTKTPQPKGAEP